jgi:phosphate:Na+ symporter
VLIAIGFGTQFIARDDKVKCYGAMVLGLGLIFFGMDLMSNATRPLRSYQPFIDLMGSMSNPLLGIVVAAAFTAIVQSSSATTGVVIVLASQGFITLEAGIALAFGANIGTCVTAFLATAGKPREATQAALVHVVFNVLGVVLWVGLIDQLADVVRWVSPTADGLSGAAKLAAETPRQIANAHTCFNAVNTLIFLAFAGPLARAIERLLPIRKAPEDEVAQPLYLDEVLLDTPDLALDRVRMELGRLGEYVIKMMERALPALAHGSQSDVERLATMDDDVDALHGAIVTYLGSLSQQHATEDQSDRITDYISTANYLENIGDTIETNLADAGAERLKHDLQISEGTLEVLGRVHEKVRWSVHQALAAVVQNDVPVATEVIDAKDDVNDLANEADTHLGQRLTAPEPNRLQAFRIESDVIENFKRIYYFAKRIAKVVAEADTAYAQESEAA